MIWVRGQIVADEALSVSVLDRTFEHGLGLFETFRTWNSRPTLLPRHLDRLTRSAAELGVPCDREALPDARAVQSLLEADGRQGDAMLRITLSGGLSESAGSTLWMRSFELPPSSPAGIVLGPAGLARVDMLARHKTLNYWPNRILYQTARDGGFDEALTLSPDGHVWEGSRSNLFLVMENELITPPSTGKLLPGIMRAVILERAPMLGLEVRETPFSLLDRLLAPEEIFLCNSVRGIMPVHRWGEAEYPAPDRSPGGSGTTSPAGWRWRERAHEERGRGGALA